MHQGPVGDDGSSRKEQIPCRKGSSGIVNLSGDREDPVRDVEDVDGIKPQIRDTLITGEGGQKIPIAGA